MTLKRSMSKFALLATAIGGIVGSGWLFGPFYAAKVAGPASVLSWVIAGGLMLFIAATFVVLTRALPIVGGTVRFFQLSHGHFVGFTFSWIAWLAWISVTPIEVLALLQYASNYVPHLMKSVDGTKVLSAYGFGAAAILMAIMYTINAMSLRFFSKTNNYIVFFKLAIPIITIAILFASQFHLSNFTAHHGFAPMGIHSIFAALPAAGVVYSFIGFNPAIQLAAEVKNPTRSIPFAIIGSLLVCIVLYTIIQIAFIGALSTAPFKAGWQHLSFAGDNGPFAGMMMGLGIAWFVKVLYFDAVVSPFGTAMVQATATGRMTYAMSQNGYFPKFLTHINKHNTPAKAIAMNSLIGLVFFFPFPSWQKMVGFLVSCLVFGYVVGPMSLMMLKDKIDFISPRKTEVLCLISFIVCNLIIYWTGWAVIKKVAVAFIIGYAVLAIYQMMGKKMELNFKRGWWVIPYIVGLTIISYIGNFGGGIKILTFGWDFVVIAAFSAVIFYLVKIIAMVPSCEQKFATTPSAVQ